MGVSNISDIFFILKVMATRLGIRSKAIIAQSGTVKGAGQTTADGIEWWQHVGFASRPSKPTNDDDAAEMMGIVQGGTDVAFASRDLRSAEIYGTLAEGETCVYSTGADGTGQARSLYKADGSITHYTKKGNAAGGAGMCIQLDAAAGAIRILNDLGHGLVIDADGVKLFTNGAATLTLTTAGAATLIATSGQAQVDGPGICIGSLAVPGLNSALTGVTGVAGKASLKVLIE